MIEYITDKPESQAETPEFLIDAGPSGRVRPWRLHRRQAETMAIICDQHSDLRSVARHIYGCATTLTYERQAGDTKKLKNAVFCRERLCPMCQWRRSLKLAAQTEQCVAAINGQGKYRWLLLTLTIRNCQLDALSGTVTSLIRAWTTLTRSKRFGETVEGWQRAVEVTINRTDLTAHPHVHALLCVRPSYFGKGYIPQADWCDMWARAAGLDYTPVCHIETVRPTAGGTIGHAAAEVSKYTAKSNDYILTDDIDLSGAIISQIYAALHGRRLVSWGGLLKSVRAALMLDSPDDGDLVVVDGELTDDATAAAACDEIYQWAIGWGDYIRRSP